MWWSGWRRSRRSPSCASCLCSPHTHIVSTTPTGVHSTPRPCSGGCWLSGTAASSLMLSWWWRGDTLRPIESCWLRPVITSGELHAHVLTSKVTQVILVPLGVCVGTTVTGWEEPVGSCQVPCSPRAPPTACCSDSPTLSGTEGSLNLFFFFTLFFF